MAARLPAAAKIVARQVAEAVTKSRTKFYLSCNLSRHYIGCCKVCYPKARCTLKLSAYQSFTRDCWRKQVPLVCGRVFIAFRQACHRRSVFNMLNNFRHEWTFPPSVRARKAIALQGNMNTPRRIALELRSYKNKHGGKGRTNELRLKLIWRRRNSASTAT